MNWIADLHTHTVACSHAYSTVLENCQAAKEAGLKYLAVTDHAPAMSDAPARVHFVNLRVLPKELAGIRLLKGVELNILDGEGNVDLKPDLLSKLDWVIASCHADVLHPNDVLDQTQAYLAIAKNPFVDMIGHSGNRRFPYDYERVIPEFARYGKVVEVNESSSVSRPGSEENCEQIIRLCKQHRVFICVNSDAHISVSVGRFAKSSALLSRLDFPKELILNSDENRLCSFLARRSAEKQQAYARILAKRGS